MVAVLVGGGGDDGVRYDGRGEAVLLVLLHSHTSHSAAAAYLLLYDEDDVGGGVQPDRHTLVPGDQAFKVI